MQNADLRHTVAKIFDQIGQAEAKDVAVYLNSRAASVGAHANLADAYTTVRPLLFFMTKNFPANSLEYQAMADYLSLAEADLVEAQLEEEETEDPGHLQEGTTVKPKRKRTPAKK
jgi:hypothetical protein